MIDFQRMTFLFATVISTLALRCEAANDFYAQASQKSISSSYQKDTPSHKSHDDDDEDEEDDDDYNDDEDDDEEEDDDDEQAREEEERKNVVPKPNYTGNKLLSDNGDKVSNDRAEFDRSFLDQTPSISVPSAPRVMKTSPVIQEEKQEQSTEPAPKPIDYSNQLNALAKELEEIKQLLNRQEAAYRGLSQKSDTVDLHLGQINAKLQQLADDQVKQQQQQQNVVQQQNTQASQAPSQEPEGTANAPQYFMDAPVIRGKPPVIRNGSKRRKVCIRPRKVCCPPTPATSQPAIIEMGRYTEDME